jgi:ABC-type lipoprotein export system ATPase subunit
VRGINVGRVRVVAASGLVKAFGEGRVARRVLDGADLEVEAGEVVAVLGRSGSGKSTLLHLLGGLDRADAGTIEVAGVRVHELDERGLTNLRRRHVGFVFQFFHLIPELTGEENLLVPARLAGGGNGAVRRAHELIARLGLADVRDRLPHTLSGGEQQRFALGRALVRDPELVLADEPTGNLDAESAATVLRLLRAAATEHERAVVLATHDAEAARMADRVVHLERGRLRAEPVVRLARAHHRP